MERYFSGKPDARQAVWDRLAAEGIARFPFPPHGRIPNFAGADAAARRLFEAPLMANVRRIKANPDAPQRMVRRLALERGIVVYMPTPRLKGGFKRLDPSRIPKDALKEAASLSKVDRYADQIPLSALEGIDLIVAGSVAVTRRGDRCGKGEGYSDLEYAILRELGHPPVPVVTTVHPTQVVDFFPVYQHDVGLSLIATPDELIEPPGPHHAPRGIDWDRVTEEQLSEMPVLRELRG